jgi:hypothetical protein
VRVCHVLLAAVVAVRAAHASPSVDLDDPRYETIEARSDILPLTEARIRRLLHAAPLPRAGWIRLDRASLGAFFDRDRLRPYSTPERPRDIAGGLALTCEHHEGRPCIGSGVAAEVDGSVGYGDVVSGTLRLRTNAGSQGYDPALAIDRAYVVGELGPVDVEVGRDILVVGPRSRTQLAWGDHAPPLDQVRVAARVDLTDSLAGSALWAVGRLRDPQRFPGTLISISRVQLEVSSQLDLGLMQLLQVGGDGAAPIGGPVDFVLEHIRRRDLSASATDSSNRRFGGDIAWRIHDLHDARLYYAGMFEDIRKARWIDAIRYDADHLFGVEVGGVTVEYHQTGVRSQEHSPRTTGLTNDGRVAGSPLGPDARSLYVAARIPRPYATLYPWIEYATLASDTYAFEVDGPITLATHGPHEFRYRLGARARIRLPYDLSLEPEVAAEHVSQLAFTSESRNNVRLGVGLVYRAQ